MFCRLVHGGHGAGDGAGHGAGDIVPPEWQDMSCGEIWRGMVKGQRRPPIDIKAANKMREEQMRQPAKRMADDKYCNAGKPSFLLNEYKQLYIAMQWKHDNGAPTAYCKLCNKEAWSPTHIYCNQHLGHLLERPYNWTEEWHDPPSLEETGIQDPRVNGITFASLAEFVFTKKCPCKHTCPLWLKKD
jgi:hypothetical protein